MLANQRLDLYHIHTFSADWMLGSSKAFKPPEVCHAFLGLFKSELRQLLTISVFLRRVSLHCLINGISPRNKNKNKKLQSGKKKSDNQQGKQVNEMSRHFITEAVQKAREPRKLHFIVGTRSAL